jgi:hypothetical protein
MQTLTYADVCRRMPTYADVCAQVEQIADGCKADVLRKSLIMLCTIASTSRLLREWEDNCKEPLLTHTGHIARTKPRALALTKALSDESGRITAQKAPPHPHNFFLFVKSQSVGHYK